MAVEICRKHGISQQTFYLWKKKYAGLGLNELRQLRDENAKLKRLVADPSLDRHILQEVVPRNCKASDHRAHKNGVHLGGLSATCHNVTP